MGIEKILEAVVYWSSAATTTFAAAFAFWMYKAKGKGIGKEAILALWFVTFAYISGIVFGVSGLIYFGIQLGAK